MDSSSNADDAELVERVQRGDAAAFAPLFERWYDRVHGVARGVVHRSDLAADVAQDAFVTAWQQIDRLDDVNAFGGWLLRITRNRALDALRHEQRSSATDDDTLTALTDRGLPSPVAARPIAGPDEAAETSARADLLWAAAAALGERDASILDLHVRHGLTPAELAADLGVEPNHAHQLVHRLRKRLADAVGAFLLWNGGSPRCEILAGRTAALFDAGTADTITRHARMCATCRDDRSQRTDPLKLFAAIPVAIAPLAHRSKAAWALESEGVPMPSHLLGTQETRSGPDGSGPGSGPPGGRSDADPPRAAPSGRPAMIVRLGAVVAMVIIVLGASAMLFADAARAPVNDDASTVTIALVAPAAPTTSAALTTTTTTTVSPTTVSPTTTAAPITVIETTTTPAPPPPPPPPPPPAPPAAVQPPAADTTTPTTAPAPPATILRFTLRPANHRCTTNALSRDAVWVTDAATSGRLQWSANRVDVAPTGTQAICVEEGEVVTLVVFNVNGQPTSATATAAS
jgi:RNA polymerase sigma factor (sigma-70 family)